MDKSIFLSVKNWAFLCVFSSFAMLLYVPVSCAIYEDITIIVGASLICIINKENLTLRLLCLSVILASVFGLVSYYYNSNSQLSTRDELYYATWFFVSMLPLFYCFFKTSDLCAKVGVAIICAALAPGVLYAFTSPKFVNISLFVFSVVVTAFFGVSALDTKDKTTRNVSLLAGLGGLTMILRNIENIVWYVCDKPIFDDWYSWIDYNKEEYPIFDFCREYSQTFTWLFFVGCALMMLFFIHIFKRSNYTLKAICFSAICAYLLIWLLSVVHSSIHFLDRLYVTSFFDLIVYTLFAFSFYKLNKKL